MNSLSPDLPGLMGVNPGSHFCALHPSPARPDRLSYTVLDEGLRHGEKCPCLIDDVEATPVRNRALERLILDASRRSAQLGVERAPGAPRRAVRLSVGDVLAFLRESVDAAIGAEFQLMGVIGEMSWALPGLPGRDDLCLCEEATVNDAGWRMPAISMCLYDLRRFGAGVLVEVLVRHSKGPVDHTAVGSPRSVQWTGEPPQGGAIAATRYPMVKVGEAGDRGWASLTDAELRVIACVARGMTNRSTAEKLYLSRHTVDAHLKHVYVKLDIHSRVELTVIALRHRVAAG